jgi:hypothetical protein|tara:strand:+ start:1021 stop:1251 length:231 start_codon:yes stop_codon:yes gene_type:complete
VTHLIVTNEGDMEYSLAYTFRLADTKSSCKKLEITFSTEGLMTIFLRNLFEDFIENGIPSDNGLDLCMYVPKEKDK